MHFHVDVIDFLTTVAYLLIFGFLLKLAQIRFPDNSIVKGLSVLTD